MLIGCTLAFTLVAADVSLPRRRVLEEATIERHGLSSKFFVKEGALNSQQHSYPQSVLDGMGRNILQHIPKGATLKLGVSPLVFSVFLFLHECCNLGLHTDVYTESLFRLEIVGIIIRKRL